MIKIPPRIAPVMWSCLRGECPAQILHDLLEEEGFPHSVEDVFRDPRGFYELCLDVVWKDKIRFYRESNLPDFTRDVVQYNSDEQEWVRLQLKFREDNSYLKFAILSHLWLPCLFPLEYNEVLQFRAKSMKDQYLEEMIEVCDILGLEEAKQSWERALAEFCGV